MLPDKKRLSHAALPLPAWLSLARKVSSRNNSRGIARNARWEDEKVRETRELVSITKTAQGWVPKIWMLPKH